MTYWVMTETDGVYHRIYSGPDKPKAREIAAKRLNSPATKSEKVVVLRVSEVTALTVESLKPVLPKDSF